MLFETASKTTESQAFLDSLALLAAPILYDREEANNNLVQTLKKAEPYVRKHQLGAPTWNKIAKVCQTDYWNSIESIDLIAETIFAKHKVFYKDTDLAKIDVDFIRNWQLYWRRDSERASNWIIQNVSRVCSSFVVEEFVGQSADLNKSQQKVLRDIQKLTKAFTGSPLNVLDIEQSKQLRDADPETYKVYLALRREVNAITKTAIQQIIRSNGRLMTINEVSNQLKRENIVHGLPTSFIGKMDDHQFYTMFDEPLQGPPIGEVIMNPRYKRGSSEYVAKYKAPGAKTYQMLYTKDANLQAQRDKFDRVNQTIELLEKARLKWIKDLKGPNSEIAVMVELLYLTQGRIGAIGNQTEGKATYGLSTIQARHLKSVGNGIRISYVGKKGSKQIHQIDPTDVSSRAVVNFLRERMESVDKTTDQIFSHGLAARVNAYIKNTLGLPITAHKFRTIRGTLLMKDLLDDITANNGPKTSEAKLAALFKKASEQVGRILGHTNKSADGVKITGTTALKSYIDPAVCISFFRHYNLRLPKQFEIFEEQT